jgi:hypothetical protein
MDQEKGARASRAAAARAQGGRAGEEPGLRRLYEAAIFTSLIASLSSTWPPMRRVA